MSKDPTKHVVRFLLLGTKNGDAPTVYRETPWEYEHLPHQVENAVYVMWRPDGEPVTDDDDRATMHCPFCYPRAPLPIDNRMAS